MAELPPAELAPGASHVVGNVVPDLPPPAFPTLAPELAPPAPINIEPHLLEGEVDAQGYRTIRKQQTFDKKPYDPEVLEGKLKELKASARKAYWHEVSVGRKWVRDQANHEKYECAFIKCNTCGHEHGGDSINPSNFVKTHFENCRSLPRCKKKARTAGMGLPTIVGVEPKKDDIVPALRPLPKLDARPLMPGKLLEGRVCLITGASTGIGKAFARTYSKHGAAVVLCGHKGGNLRTTMDECRGLGATEASFIEADLASPQDVKALADDTLAKLGSVDVLVNCASFFVDGTPEAGDAQAWDYMLACNVSSPIRLMRLLSPRMIERGGGVVINVIADPDSVPRGSAPAFVASQHAVRHWSVNCSQSLRDKNVMVMLMTMVCGTYTAVSQLNATEFPDFAMEDFANLAMLPFSSQSLVLEEVKFNYPKFTMTL